MVEISNNNNDEIKNIKKEHKKYIKENVTISTIKQKVKSTKKNNK